MTATSTGINAVNPAAIVDTFHPMHLVLTGLDASIERRVVAPLATHRLTQRAQQIG